MEKFRN